MMLGRTELGLMLVAGGMGDARHVPQKVASTRSSGFGGCR